MKAIFVFGSNLAGRHGAGSARAAMQYHGAIYGIGEGLQGSSYAIPTKGFKLELLPLDAIKQHIATFIRFATDNPNLTFNVVKIGCGLAGRRELEIAPMFRRAPSNCTLPDGWRE